MHKVDGMLEKILSSYSPLGICRALEGRFGAQPPTRGLEEQVILARCQQKETPANIGDS